MGTQGQEGHDPDAPKVGDSPESTAIVAFTAPVPVAGERNESAAAALGAREAASIQARTIVALNRPRNLDVVRETLFKACDRFLFADAAVYEKPVGGGKTVSGLSIRFAEEAARAWKNLEVSIAVIAEDDEGRTIEGTAVDLENNLVHRTQIRVPKYVERLQPRKGDEILGKRTNSAGKTTYKIRASDDAMFTEQQKNAAKARREVILAHIPSDIKEECEERIETTMEAIGGKDPEKFRATVLAAFKKVEVSEEMVAEFLGKSVSQMNVKEMMLLKRIYRGISEGEGSWQEAMDAKHPKKDEPASAGKGANETLRQTLGVEKKADVPDLVTKIRAIKPKDRNDDDKEYLRQWEQEHPGL